MRDHAETALYRLLWIQLESHELVIYLLRMATRAMAAMQSFTEMLNLTGPKGCGKDFFAGVIRSFLGESSNNGYAATLPRTYFHTASSSNAEAAPPFLNSLSDVRFVTISEPPDQEMNTGALKPFCEQSTPLPARANYARKGEKMDIKMRCLLVVLSNDSARVKAADRSDEAAKDRINEVQYPNLFVSSPRAGTNERLADGRLKVLADTDAFGLELFMWARLLYKTLGSEICKFRKIEPIPMSVQQSTAAIFEGSDQARLMAYLQTQYRIVLRPEAALASEVVSDIREFLGRKQVGVLLTYIGASTQKHKRGPHYIFAWDKHPDVQGTVFLAKGVHPPAHAGA